MGRLRLVGLGVAAVLVWQGCNVEDDGGADVGAGGGGGEAQETSGAPGHVGGGNQAGGAGDASDMGGQANGTAGSDSELGGAAGAGDAGGAGGAPAETGPASVTLWQRYADEPFADGSVVFYDPSGSVTAVVEIDANGSATHDVTAGSFVTVAHAVPGQAQRELVTFFDVQPGDDLLTRDTLTPDDATPVGTMSISFDLVANGWWYAVSTICPLRSSSGAGTAGPFTIDVYPDCIDDSGNVTLLGWVNPNGGPMLAIAVAEVPFVDQGTFNLSTWAAPTTDFSLSITPPVDTVGGTLRLDAMHEAQTYWPQIGYFFDSLPTTWGFPRPSSGIDSILGAADFKLAPSGGWESHRGRQTRYPTSGDHDIDLSALLPVLEGPAASGDAQGLPAISWESAPLTDADGGLLTVRASDDLTWTLVVPPSVPSPVTPPALPAELAAFQRPAATPFKVLGMSFTKSTSLGSYAAFRHAIGRRINDAHAFPAPTTGDFVTSRSWIEPAP